MIIDSKDYGVKNQSLYIPVVVY